MTDAMTLLSSSLLGAGEELQEEWLFLRPTQPWSQDLQNAGTLNQIFLSIHCVLGILSPSRNMILRKEGLPPPHMGYLCIFVSMLVSLWSPRVPKGMSGRRPAVVLLCQGEPYPQGTESDHRSVVLCPSG